MRTRWMSAIAIMAVCACQALAQTSADVKGVVTDTSGAVVPGARIEVTRLDNGTLQPGRYSLGARKQGC